MDSENLGGNEGGKFRPGQSGNPTGKPRCARRNTEAPPTFVPSPCTDRRARSHGIRSCWQGRRRNQGPMAMAEGGRPMAKRAALKLDELKARKTGGETSVRRQSPVIPTADSMSAFMRELGARARLSQPHPPGSWSRRWLQRSPPSLLATAACSGLRSAPDGRW
jgi:hypothetical protein